MAWIERVKTISLVALVISSVILTGVLWYSTPSYEEQKDIDYMPAPYITKDNYVSKNLYQLTAPPFLVTHINGRHQLITHEQKVVFQTLQDINGLQMDNFQLITPSTDDWKLLFQQSSGLELAFFHDIPLDQVDASFNQLLANDPIFQRLTSISRVWLYENPTTGKTNVWFISDHDGKIIQATTNLEVHQLSSTLASFKQVPALMTVEAIPTNGKNPWDKVNQAVPFSRIVYLPTPSVAAEQITYAKQPINIDNMKAWLFPEDNIEPIDLSKNESVFMDNNQILTYYKQDSYMVYADNTRVDGVTTNSISKDIDSINTKFMAKHHGWTGDYVLEKMVNKDSNHLYSFRLIVQALPVFWSKKEAKTPQLDMIQIQTGPSISSVVKYERSLLYLSTKPIERKTHSLLGKQIVLTELTKRHIPIASVERIYPINLAKTSPQGRILLTPCWQVELASGETIQIGGAS